MSEQTVTDSTGRKIGMKMLTTFERFELFKPIPNSDQMNAMRLGWMLAAATVREIDDIPVPMPTTMKDIEELIVRLGDPGLTAAQVFITEVQEGAVEVAKK